MFLHITVSHSHQGDLITSTGVKQLLYFPFEGIVLMLIVIFLPKRIPFSPVGETFNCKTSFKIHQFGSL